MEGGTKSYSGRGGRLATGNRVAGGKISVAASSGECNPGNTRALRCGGEKTVLYCTSIVVLVIAIREALNVCL